MDRQIGQTKDVGFQFGVRRTFPVGKDKMWEFLFSERGLYLWLGKLNSEFLPNRPYQTENGVTGFVRVFNSNSHVRINWKRESWNNMSTLQIRVIGDQKKSTLAIHQEKLLHSEQRSEMQAYWNAVVDKLTIELNKG